MGNDVILRLKRNVHGGRGWGRESEKKKIKIKGKPPAALDNWLSSVSPPGRAYITIINSRTVMFVYVGLQFRVKIDTAVVVVVLSVDNYVSTVSTALLFGPTPKHGVCVREARY